MDAVPLVRVPPAVPPSPHSPGLAEPCASRRGRGRCPGGGGRWAPPPRPGPWSGRSQRSAGIPAPRSPPPGRLGAGGGAAGSARPRVPPRPRGGRSAAGVGRGGRGRDGTPPCPSHGGLRPPLPGRGKVAIAVRDRWDLGFPWLRGGPAAAGDGKGRAGILPPPRSRVPSPSGDPRPPRRMGPAAPGDAPVSLPTPGGGMKLDGL